MAGTNVSLIFQAILAVINNNVTPAPQVAVFDFGNPTLTGTTFIYDPYVQALTSGTIIQIAAIAPVYAVLVQNLGTGNITVAYTPNGGSGTNIQIGPNGVFVYFDPSEDGSGIDLLTLTGVGGTQSAAVLVGL